VVLRTRRERGQEVSSLNRAAEHTRRWAYAGCARVVLAGRVRRPLPRGGLPTAGVMAEVPDAGCAPTHSLAPSTSSASGRTNDLSQCAYAADRQVGELAELLDAWQPALLALIAACGEAGRRPACPGASWVGGQVRR
jgi:hypothetical protein